MDIMPLFKNIRRKRLHLLLTVYSIVLLTVRNFFLILCQNLLSCDLNPSVQVLICGAAENKLALPSIWQPFKNMKMAVTSALSLFFPRLNPSVYPNSLKAFSKQLAHTAQTVGTEAMALCCSASEYTSLAWHSSARAKQVHTALRESYRNAWSQPLLINQPPRRQCTQK